MDSASLDHYPVAQIKHNPLQAINHSHTLVLSAPPGAGKSTVLPLWLLALPKFSNKKIIMLQPRRIATRTVAQRLAQLLGEPVGQTVGYQMRNDSKYGKQTRLLVVTEGVLTRMMLDDNELADVGLIIFDEFHERSLHADFGLALARDIQLGLRDDLCLLLMSATIDNQYLEAALPDAVYLHSEGKSYPVTIDYQPLTGQQRLAEHVARVIIAQTQQQLGSILVFLPGSGEIRQVQGLLQQRLSSSFAVHALYGDLSIEEQRHAIAPAPEGSYKVVLATNIAETSITIEGVTVVIDSGLEKVASYHPSTLTNRLTLQQISKASAIQRCGRAGRVAPGHCIRLYSKDNYERRMEHGASQISQSDLLPLTLDVASWQVTEFSQLPFIELPNASIEQHCWQLLSDLQLVNDARRLTKHGQRAAQLPTHPRFAHMILSSLTIDGDRRAVVSLACLLSALLEQPRLPSEYASNSDISLCLRSILTAGNHRALKQAVLQQARRLYNAATKAVTSVNLAHGFCDHVDKLPESRCGVLLAFAYPERIAKLRDTGNRYFSASGKGLELDSLDPLSGEAYLSAAKVYQSKRELRIELAAPISKGELEQYFSHLCQRQDVTYFATDTQRIMSERQQRLGHIILSRQALKASKSTLDYSSVWVDYVRAQGLTVLALDQRSENLLSRLRWLNNFVDNAGFGDFSERHLLATLEHWFAPYVRDVDNLKKLQTLNYYDMLLNILDYQQQQQLNVWAPEYYQSPLGRKFRYQYGEFLEPKVALPMQQVYGLQYSPTVANGRINALLELLSPAGRVIQITKDLATFWQGSYADVQKDMKANYPKHYWPDDPASASPTNKTKKYINNG
ncbi:ATP-dependent helicase HrpB [Thalassotalea ponticola]|uniref:ATP-dependent helicase HrpB n=1 Tax=Thalassotalea ponticola TaxID=1523392 RepID=UPI0025B59391|nr:ATP-dependent helicase HrpB [Thalassotalea ponticola]MDN3653475.1 ATP-dependent helicase HrpB [Thalassotalea ponticola]